MSLTHALDTVTDTGDQRTGRTALSRGTALGKGGCVEEVQAKGDRRGEQSERKPNWHFGKPEVRRQSEGTSTSEVRLGV
jgi:hypothetical protein